MFAQASALRRLAEIAPASLHPRAVLSLAGRGSGVMQSPDGEAAIEEQGPSFDVVGEVVGVAAALATEPPQEASVRGDEGSREGGESVQDQEAKNIEILAIGIGHDVSKYYDKAFTIENADKLAETMLSQITELFSVN